MTTMTTITMMMMTTMKKKSRRSRRQARQETTLRQEPGSRTKTKEQEKVTPCWPRHCRLLH
jgi:hypothetical protein